MKNRIGAALLAASLTLSLSLPISAAGVAGVEECAQVVGALNIMVGDQNGDLGLGRSVTRAEFVTMAVKASPMREQVGEAATAPYPDVPRKHWGAGYVSAAVQMGLTSGYLDGTFRPNNEITLAEGVTIVLKLLGYTGADFAGAYPTAQMSLYRSLDLDEGVVTQDYSAPMTRLDAMYLFYNLLSTKNKSGQYHMNVLGYSLNQQGEVDRVALMGEVMDGPVVVSGDWQSQIPMDLKAVSFTRDGQRIEQEELQEGDVLYWNKGMRRVWVYDDRVTGTLQALMPSAAKPTSVTVAGQTYTLETDQAAYALSDLGSYRLGDTVTLVLGRNGGVAAVVAPIAEKQSKIGMVTALHKASYSDGNGSSYTADTVTIQATDGKVYSYPWSTKHYDVGDLVRVEVDGTGSVTLKSLERKKLTGKVSGNSLGGYVLAADVEIMDTYKKTAAAIRVFPERLAGVSMQGDMVRYYTLNARGEIQHLVLEDVTGDMHQYGVATSVQDLSFGMSVMGSYTVDLGGQSTTFVSQDRVYPVDVGPFVMKGTLPAPETMKQLHWVLVDRVEGRELVTERRSYKAFDSMLVYERRDGGYYLSTLERVDDGQHRLTAWYDKAPNEGGCVRILIAEAL